MTRPPCIAVRPPWKRGQDWPLGGQILTAEKGSIPGRRFHAWQREYNEARAHWSLANETPKAFALSAKIAI